MSQSPAPETYQYRAPTLLVVAATAAEARYVPADIPVVITGIGKTAAAARTARALAEFDDAEDLVVVNLGTAGALRDSVSGLHVVTRVTNHDMNGDAIRVLGYDPEEVLELEPVSALETVSLAAASLATGDLFVTDPEVKERLATEHHLVDMEGYAVAWVARDFGRPLVMVKHVSDAADESAWEWTEVVDRSARTLATWLIAARTAPANS